MTAYVPPLYRSDMEARIRAVTVDGASLPVMQRAALSRRVAGLRWARWPRCVVIDGGGPVLACGGSR